MNELEELLKQKRDIESRIKELKHQEIRCNRATLKLDHYNSFRSDEWKVMYKVDCEDILGSKDSNRLVATATTKNQCIENLKIVIEDLQGLLKKVEE